MHSHNWIAAVDYDSCAAIVILLSISACNLAAIQSAGRLMRVRGVVDGAQPRQTNATQSDLETKVRLEGQTLEEAWPKGS